LVIFCTLRRYRVWQSKTAAQACHQHELHQVFTKLREIFFHGDIITIRFFNKTSLTQISHLDLR